MNYDELYISYKNEGLSKVEYFRKYENELVANGVSYHAFRSAMKRREQGNETTEHYYNYETLLDDNKKKVNELLKSANKIAFISDVHIPYHSTRACLLAGKIIKDFNPDLLTGANDFFDFEEWSKWDKLKTPASMLWSSDLNNPIKMAKQIWSILNPHKKPAIGLIGNHDAWLFNYLFRNYTPSTPVVIEWFIKQMLDMNIYITDLVQNRIQWYDLLMIHGTVARTDTHSTAKALHHKYLASYARKGKLAPDIVYGHDHKAGTFHINGKTVYSNPCLCRYDLQYLKDEPDWQQGITLFTKVGNSIFGENIVFKNEGEYIVAFYNGKKYSV